MQLLHSNIIGEGKPLIILHGFLGMSDNWKSMGLKYADLGFQVHLLDLRNHGKSFHSSNFNYDLLSEDLKNYLEEHQLPPAVILGHSMGGKTAMLFACRYPQMTHKLLVADIAPKFYPPHHQDIINGLKAINLDFIKSRTEADKQLSRYLPNLSIRQFLLKNLYWKEKGVLDFRFNLGVLSEKMEEVGENIGSTDSYNGPTLFLRGDKSEYINAEDFPAIKRHFPLATIETVDKAGHWLHAENPAQFFEKSAQFIQ